MSVSYKGFIIETKFVRELQGTWQFMVFITNPKSSDGTTKTKRFESGGEFKSKDEAEGAAIELGRQIIDDKVPDYSVDSIL